MAGMTDFDIDEDESNYRCPECGAITREGCQQKDAVPCEWLRDRPDPMDELEGYL